MSGGKVDWDRELCGLSGHRMIVEENKVYVFGGYAWLNDSMRSNASDYGYFANSHVQILDFSHALDLNSEYPVTLQPVDEKVFITYYGNAFSSGEDVYLFGGRNRTLRYTEDSQEFYAPDEDQYGDHYTQVWHYYPEKVNDNWGDHWDNGIGLRTPFLAFGAFDVGRKIGWMYGGQDNDKRATPHLIKFDTQAKDGKPVPEIIETANRPVVPDLVAGTMVHIDGYGTGTESDRGGILVAIGGYKLETDTVHITMIQLTSVDVYDINSKTWYKQQTTSTSTAGFPEARSNMCSIIASAPDNSSHSIYVYGGAYGPNVTHGDMWILSIPSFTWHQAYPGDDSSLNVASHDCVNLQDRYMLSYRGVRDFNDPLKCNKAGGINLFDISNLEWTKNYEFSTKKEYSVPTMISNVIGGDSTGGATLLPLDNFSHPRLKDIFAAPTKAPPPTPPPQPPQKDGPGGKSAHIAILVGGIVGGIGVGILFVVLILYMRKRHRLKKAPMAQQQQQIGNVSDQLRLNHISIPDDKILVEATPSMDFHQINVRGSDMSSGPSSPGFAPAPAYFQ